MLLFADLKSVFRDHQGEVGWTLVTIALAEFVGTALLIFFTCLSSLVGMSQDPPVPLQVALCSGLTVAIIIQIFGHISAAHLNPAVSIAAVVLEQINIPLAIVYIVSECSGAIVGFGLLK
ncbi:unnamed protein product, partial [Timema podura]|nr:unnamed protein product [Timema podura]